MEEACVSPTLHDCIKASEELHYVWRWKSDYIITRINPETDLVNLDTFRERCRTLKFAYDVDFLDERIRNFIKSVYTNSERNTHGCIGWLPFESPLEQAMANVFFSGRQLEHGNCANRPSSNGYVNLEDDTIEPYEWFASMEMVRSHHRALHI